jgi:hypothetical protein
MKPVEGSEILKVVNVELPDVLTAAAHESSEINTTGFARGLLLLHLGVLEATTTVIVTVTHASESGGSFATLYTATALDVDDDEKIYYLDLDLLNPNINPYLKVTITVANDVCDAGAMMILFGANREAVSQPSATSELSGSWASGIVVSY